MARLIDRLLSGARLPADVRPETDLMCRVALENLRDVPIIVADNVADYLYAGTDQEYWDVARDFPGLVPPFDRFYIEYRRPATVRSCDYGVVDARQAEWNALGAFVQGEQVLGDWALRFTFFVGLSDSSQPVWNPVFYTLRTDPEGNVVIGSKGDWMHVRSYYLYQHDLDGAIDMFNRLYPCLLAISFMNCRNVERLPSPPVPDKLRKANLRRNPDYRDPIRYTTLHIKPIQTILETEGQAAKHGLKQALHICRGHFKDYTEHGLFGSDHQRGRYWWSAHVRGQLTSGAVVKTYEVEAPGQGDRPVTTVQP